MKRSAVALGITGSALLLGACMEGVPLTAKAATAERLECPSGAASPDDLRLRESMTVLKIEPEYWRNWCWGTSKVTGTKLLVRRPNGVSSEELARNLQCANAQAALGRVEPAGLPNDPYGLPGAWVDIDVSPEQGNLAVTLRADSVSNNILLLRRATAFASAQRSVASR